MHLERFEKHARHSCWNEIFRVEFFQAVRLLERMEIGLANPVGYFVPPGSARRCAFTAHNTLAFPPSQLYSSASATQSGQLRLVVQFMGSCAASITIMPIGLHGVSAAAARTTETLAMRDFFDIFNHRMISLFYRGWEKYRFFTSAIEAGHGDGLSPRIVGFSGAWDRGACRSGRQQFPMTAP